MPRRAGPAVALCLLACSAAVNYGYELAPLSVQADVQNAVRACVGLGMLGPLWAFWRWPCWSVFVAGLYCIGEELLTAGCSVAYILRGAGQAVDGNQCTQLTGYDFNSLGVLLLLVALWCAIRQDVRRG